MPSNGTDAPTAQNEITRHAARYVTFGFLFLFSLWIGYSAYTDYQTLKTSYEKLPPEVREPFREGRGGYLVVDGQTWIRINSRPPKTLWFLPEDQPILLSTASGVQYEKYPSGELYTASGNLVSLMEGSDYYLVRAKDPQARVRVRIIYQ